jgi:hypothetical protein
MGKGKNKSKLPLQYTCVQCCKPSDPLLKDFCSQVCHDNYVGFVQTEVGLSPSDLTFWSQYRLLQQDFLSYLDYIHPSTDNFATFSSRLLAFIRSVGSKVDSACKKIIVSPSPNDTNMKHWREYLEEKFKISRVCLPVPVFHTYIRPFREFELDKSPIWWQAFTNLKHHRDDCFLEATLENGLNALGGLFLLNVIILEPAFQKIWDNSLRSPHYSDHELLDEVELLFRLWGPGVEVTSGMGLKRFRIVTQ